MSNAHAESARWAVKELADVSSINYGYTEKAASDPIGPHFLRITDIQNGTVDWEQVPFCAIGTDELTKYQLATGDIVFARTGATTGKSFLITDPPQAVFASYLIRLRLLNRELLPDFVAYYFQTSPYWKAIEDGSTGSAQGGFNATKLGAMRIPVPPLPAQRRIVAVLDEAFESIATARANAEKNLLNAQRLRETWLNGTLSQRGVKWRRARIDQVCVSIMDCVNKTAPTVEGPTPFRMLRTTNIRHGRVSLLATRYVTEDTYRVWTRRQVPRRGDVILTREAPMGEVGMLLTDEPVFLGQRLVSYRANPEVMDGRFLLLVLRSSEAQQQIRAFAAGATVQHMRVPHSKTLLVPIPALSEQAEFVTQAERVHDAANHLESLCQQKLAALDELKQALLDRAFSGLL